MRTVQLSNAQILTIMIALKRKETATQFAIKLASRFAYDDDKDTITKKELLDIVKDILKEKENDF